jgi:uncharacterized membrane protein (DUF4010 family)
MMDLALLRSLAVATLIGALIGLEREYHHRLKGEKGFAGLRTFMFFCALGNLSAWLSRTAFPYVLPVAMLGLVLLLAANYHRTSQSARDRGMTTEIAALLTFLLGSLVAAGETEVAVASAVVLASLLSAKPAFLRWVEGMKPEDIYTTLKFAVVTFVVLPLLPDRAFGPLDAFNPHDVWMMVVLIAGVSFLGYIVLKLLGTERGLVLTGILGGLASSTAVAVSFSRRSREDPGLVRSCSLAIVIASTIMAGRIAVLVGAVYPRLLGLLWGPLAAIALAGTLVSLVLWRGVRTEAVAARKLEIRHPFRLTSVVGFGAAYALVLFLVKAVQAFFPKGGLGVVAALSGLPQVDAMTVSAAQLAGKELSLPLAASAVMVAALANTVAKALIAVVLGHRSLRAPVLFGLGVVFAAGVLGTLAFLP